MGVAKKTWSAGDEVTATDINGNFEGAKQSVTAGATISGDTLPVPVYQNDTDNEFYACDANDTSAMKFLGFAITDGTDGNAFTVQFNGVVEGFSGLSEGEKYYVQDTAGTIGTSAGTYEIVVGVAISTTQLLIHKGARVMSGTQSFSSTTTSAKTIGFRPSKVTIFAVGYNSTDVETGFSQGAWTVGGDNNCIYGSSATVTPFIAGADATNAWNAYSDGGNDTHTGTVTTITDTGFTLDNTKTGSNLGTVYLHWIAEGEL